MGATTRHGEMATVPMERLSAEFAGMSGMKEELGRNEVFTQGLETSGRDWVLEETSASVACSLKHVEKTISYICVRDAMG